MAISGVGTEFRRWNSTTGEWDAIAEINSITGPGMSRLQAEERIDRAKYAVEAVVKLHRRLKGL